MWPQNQVYTQVHEGCRARTNPRGGDINYKSVRKVANEVPEQKMNKKQENAKQRFLSSGLQLVMLFDYVNQSCVASGKLELHTKKWTANQKGQAGGKNVFVQNLFSDRQIDGWR